MINVSEEFVHIKGKPEKMVVFLHGYGDDAKKFNKILKPMLDALDNCVILIPCAPTNCEIENRNCQWYSIAEFDPEDVRISSNDFDEVIKIYSKGNKSIKEGFAIINNYIETKLKEYGLKYKDLYVCGFSQGASLSLYTGLMLKDKIAGIISFSGILFPHNILIDHYKNSCNVLLIHGKNDDVVRFEALDFSKESLEKMSCLVSTYAIDNTKHWVTEDGLLIASSFINAKK